MWRGSEVAKRPGILVRDANAVVTETDHITGMNDVLVDLFVIEKGTVSAIQVLDVRGVEIGKDARMMSADTAVGNTYIVITRASQADGTGPEFEFMDV